MDGRRCTTLGLWSALALGLMGCGDGTGPVDGASRVAIAFRSAGAGAASVVPAHAPRVATNRAARALTLSGTNGTLTLDEVWIIVAEFELGRADDDDCEEGPLEDDCEEFEAPPQFIQIPLEGGVVPVVSQAVPPDVYEELEFEIEDLEFDDDDPDEDAAEIQALFNAIRAQFPDWPEQASMLITGSFTPTGGAPVPFRVFFEAEVEIEIEFEPPLDLRTGDATVTVTVDPAVWFAQPGGTVLDLSQFNGQVVEFEVEMENGFTEIEFDDD